MYVRDEDRENYIGEKERGESQAERELAHRV